tara:strand:- start:22344 stop:25883 length:3540 start_codon:yes stop_codon:yes gene_type:complete
MFNYAIFKKKSNNIYQLNFDPILSYTNVIRKSLFMRGLYSFIVVVLFVLVSASPMVMFPNYDDSPEFKVGPKSDAVDFSVLEIELGNSSNIPMQWEQPDSSFQEYLIKGDAIQINVTFIQNGFTPTQVTANATLQVWHPIGFLIKKWDFNVTLSSSQSARLDFIWTPNTAHSALSGDGFLSGGMIIVGLVDAGLQDGDNTNDRVERSVPVAAWSDDLDNGFCGDEGNEGKYCTNIPQGYGRPTWFGAGYESNGMTQDGDFPTGTWRMDNASSADGEWHWKVSGDDSNRYASNRYDRLHWGWVTTNNQDGCADGVWGDGYAHGLGQGDFSSSLSSLYSQYLCKVKIKSPNFYSMQIVTKAWGNMDSGDSILLETDSGYDQEYYNYTAINLSSNEGDWNRLIWNVSDLHQSGGFTLSFLFKSDGSDANEGIHIDSFLIFGIERFTEYTLNAVCNDPLPNSYIVLAADSNPPSLHCRVFNKGYIDITLRYFTTLSNQSWMYQYPLRIDSNNPIDHDNFVVSKVIKARTITDVWFNLSIPDGTLVQELDWIVDINDGVLNNSKYSLVLPVKVDPTYSITLTPDKLSNPAATLFPGDKANITMNLKNNGNQLATWNLGGTFDTSEWPSENIQWYDSATGEAISLLNSSINEEFILNAEITAPEGLAPGIYTLTLIANGRAPATFQSETVLYIEVPVYHNLVVAPISNSLIAPANGYGKIVEIFLINNGNTEESFDISVTTDNWRLLASTSATLTPGIPSNGGDTSISLLLPMPEGILNGTYRITVHAASTLNPEYVSSANIYLTVPVTNLVEIPDLDMTEEIFSAGSDDRTLRWEIWNRGNVADSFDISFLHTSDVFTSAQGLSEGRTPYISPGSSYNLSVSYSFGEDADGTRTITLGANSVESSKAGGDASGTGQALFNVGTVGWLRALSPPLSSDAMSITESGESYSLEYTILSMHPTDDQQIRAEVELENQYTVYSARVDEDDRDFVLKAGESRTVTIFLDVREEDLENLNMDQVDFEVTLVVTSELDVSKRTTTISLTKPVPLEVGPDAGDYVWITGNIVLIIIGTVVFLGVSVMTFRIVRKANSPLEEISTLDGYNMTMNAWDDEASMKIPLPSADMIANSMFGGSEEIFKQPSPDLSILENLESSNYPPIPESGLPAGWSLEQWNHYGQKWLDERNLE